jgi:hypothetical protein
MILKQKEINALKTQLQKKIVIPEIDMKLFADLEKKSEFQLTELRQKADKRLKELEGIMDQKYTNQVWFLFFHCLTF